jgi:DNA processing protein
MIKDDLMKHAIPDKKTAAVWLPRSRTSSGNNSNIDSDCPYSREQLTALIALQYIDGLGPVSSSLLLAKAGSIDALIAGAIDPMDVASLRAPCRQALQQFLRNPRQVQQWQLAEQSVEWLVKTGSNILVRDDPRFPSLLKELPDCPQLIYLAGQLDSFKSISISIVGTRKPSAGAQQFTEQLAAELSDAGLLITSGMATGIDAAAHRGSLRAGGKTAAVWAAGLDVVYPREHLSLAQHILENGCVVTEMPLGTASKPIYFPRRNRLVSGISLGVIVVQAALPSGSLITANYAAEQNREVFAVPGSIQNPLSAGCHQLIKDGATLIESAEDVITAIESLQLAQGLKAAESEADKKDDETALHQAEAALLAGLSVEMRVVLDAIGYDPVPYELIDARIERGVDNLSAVLVDLELQGIVTVVGGLYSR